MKNAVKHTKATKALSLREGDGKPIPVKSSFIRSVAYTATTKRLVVNFRKGGAYLYTGVKSVTATRFLKAKGIGSYFARNIRGQYHTLHLKAGS